MGFSCGIIGLPNVGKSTIFNALTRASVAASNYPFCTIDPNVGVVPVPDARLDKLAELVPAKRVIPTSMEFLDIAGLVKGASKGEGLGNQFLSHIGRVDAIAHIVRCFESDEVAHVTGSVDPVRDIEIVNTELALRDLSLVASATSRMEKASKTGDKKATATIKLLREIERPLNEGHSARRVTEAMNPTEREAIQPLNLLTAKPLLYVANIQEKDIAGPSSGAVEAVKQIAEKEAAGCVLICGAIESEIASLESDDERSEYMEAVGLKESGLLRFIREGYDLLHLVTFFTIVSKEHRAWTLSRGSTALEAAAKIHTDMARGFIRAEVVSYDDFVACGSELACREQGRMRVEGKTYQIQDGDVVHFRFNT